MDPAPADAASLTRSVRFQAIVEPLQPAFDALDAFLEEQVAAFEPEVRPLVQYCLGHSGKKLRPILVFTMAMDSEGFSWGAPLIKAAAIVELVHLATLVHDDILDEADVRHRTETVVARDGPHVAVLLGDALFAHALHLAATYPAVDICRAVSRATRQVCSGEIAQTFARGAGIPDTDAYFRMIDLKTAELFAVSAWTGGFLAGFDARQLAAAERFARQLGIAYQLYDDAADIFAREEQAGKTLGTDLATGKHTLPILYWVESLAGEQREQVLAQLDNGGLNRREIRAALERAGILQRTREAFNRRISAARDAIADIPGASRQAALRQLAGFVESAWNKFTIP
jgi:octaprenyl-diphosphate synthase